MKMSKYSSGCLSCGFANSGGQAVDASAGTITCGQYILSSGSMLKYDTFIDWGKSVSAPPQAEPVEMAQHPPADGVAAMIAQMRRREVVQAVPRFLTVWTGQDKDCILPRTEELHSMGNSPHTKYVLTYSPRAVEDLRGTIVLGNGPHQTFEVENNGTLVFSLPHQLDEYALATGGKFLAKTGMVKIDWDKAPEFHRVIFTYEYWGTAPDNGD